MILTAIDIDNNNKTIDKQVEEKVMLNLKKRITREVTELKKHRALEKIVVKDGHNKDIEIQNPNPQPVTIEEKEEIRQRLLNDEETAQDRLIQRDFIIKRTENYYLMRETLQDLNELNEFSAEIERNQLQTIDNFKTYQELVKLNLTILDKFHKYRTIRQSNIDTYVQSYKNKQLPFKVETLDLLIRLHELYKVTKDEDDIDLFDKFGMDSNIDISNKLADYYLHKVANSSNNSDLYGNFINDWYQDTNNPLSSVSKRNIVSNKMLGLLLLTNSGTGRTSFVSCNQVSCFDNTYSTTFTNKYTYVTRTLGELLLEITNPDLENIPKENRKQFYCTYDGTRPLGTEYYKWNGLQVFDIDLKEWEQIGYINILKQKLFEYLCDYHWFLWIAKSASGKGLHIYTKVTPPHHVYTDKQDNDYISKYWYKVNYNYKSSIIYDIFYRIHKDSNNRISFKQSEFNDDFELKYLDNVINRITAGIRLTHDKDVLVNHNFIDLHPGLGLSQTNDGYNHKEAIDKILFRETDYNKKSIDIINNDLRVEDLSALELSNKKEEIDLTKYDFANDLSKFTPIPKQGINYNVRYNVVNTLASLFGKEGLPIAHQLLQSDVCKNVQEINSFYSCAISNKKQPSKLGLDILKSHGIIKHVKEEIKSTVDNIFKNGIRKAIENSLNNQMLKPTIELKEHEYLSDRMDYLLNPLNGGFTNEKINILLSPPGTGKCLGFNTGVLMYDGSIKKVQDIVVGDQLMGLDSTPRNVLSLARGREEMFEIKPNKGKAWTCNKSHILSVIESGVWKDYQRGQLPNSMDIEDMDITRIQNLPKNHRKKLFQVPLDFPKKETLIPPYILGLWLGDGLHTSVEFAVGDIDRDITVPLLKAYANKYGYVLSEYKDKREKHNVSSFRIIKSENKRNKTFENVIHKYFESYDLIGNKHIPKEYLLNDRKTRLMLFAGIVDSDGGGSDGTYDIITKLDSLKDDYVWLCRSLGYHVSINKKLVKFCNGKEINKEYWRIQVSGDFSDLPIRIERKKFTRTICKNPLVNGFKIKSIGEGDYYGFVIDGDHRFLLEDFTVTHNTHIILELARQGKKILLVEPFVSVIKNKVESDEELMEIFDVFYDDKDLNKAERGVNAISTFDKFSKSNYEKISSMFDYICIDESHLLFTSSYRIEATSNAVRKIKELFYISSNNPFAAKIIMMTGTETGDCYFFGDCANVIRVSKKSLTKSIEFLICDDTLDCITRLSFKAKQLIEEGYRLIIPTNKGEIYSHKLIGMVEYLLGRSVKFGYYKSSNSEQEICSIINKQNTVGDYEIIFCSNYLSVGVDIVDTLKFASLYFGPFSGYEIEQFNARIRKKGIRSIYCIQTEKNDGTTNDLLIEEPNMVLKLTEEDVEHFMDDKQIASAKQEFIAQYDPVLHKIVTPGFSYYGGAIRFNQEEYELISFETKFLEVMVHPVKVSRELSKYGYKVTVCDDYDGLSIDTQNTLKKIGIESAKNEKQRKHTLLIGTFKELVDNNYYISPEGLEFTDIISWIGKNKSLVEEDREMENYVTVVYNHMASPVKVIVKSKSALDKMWSSAKFLISKYSIQKAKDIIDQYQDSNGILRFKYFERAIHLLKLIDKSNNNELSEPVFKTLDRMYDWLDKFTINKNTRVSQNAYAAEVDSWTNSYIDMLNIKITSSYGYEKIRDGIIEMLNDLAYKNTSKEGVRFEINKLPEANSNNVKYKEAIDTMVQNMFRISSESISINKRPKRTHIILTEQTFSHEEKKDKTTIETL